MEVGANGVGVDSAAIEGSGAGSRFNDDMLGVRLGSGRGNGIGLFAARGFAGSAVTLAVGGTCITGSMLGASIMAIETVVLCRPCSSLARNARMLVMVLFALSREVGTFAPENSGFGCAVDGLSVDVTDEESLAIL